MRSRVFRAALFVAALGAAVAPAGALAVSPPKLVTAFTPATIPVGGTSSLSFTITNTNASKLTGVGLSETLPSGVVVDNPNGASGTCGSAGVLTANPGGTAISLTGGSLAASANCVVSINVTSTTPGTYPNNSVGAGSTEGGTGTGDTQSLTVYPLPTISVTSPRNNATFAFGKKVKVAFTCTEGAGAPGINDCEADDDDTGASYTGAPYASSSQLLDTTTPGKHTLTFLAVSLDSGEVTQDETYTVQPDNKFMVSTPKPGKHGKLAFGLKLPGAGSVSITETTAGGKKTTIASKTVTVKGKKTLHVTLAPSKAAAQLLAALNGAKTTTKKKAKNNATLPAKLTISYTPKHGVKRTQTVKGIQLEA